MKVPRSLEAVPISTVDAVRRLEEAVEILGRRIGERTRGGRLVRLDGKNACNGGRWGNNLSESKTWGGDPINCMRNRDRVNPPVLRVEADCDRLNDLVWSDVFEESKRILGIAMGGKPRSTDPWTIQYRWTKAVMTLVSMAYESTNIQPIFYYPALWATERPRFAWGGSRDNPSDLALRPWGEYTSALTYDGRRECLDSSGADLRLIGGGLPRRILQWMSHQKRSKLATLVDYGGRLPPAVVNDYGWYDSCGKYPYPWTGPSWGEATGLNQQQAAEIANLIWQPGNGLTYEREAGSGSPMCATPSIFNGPWITDNSATMQALKGVSFDPWTTRGFGGSWADDVYPLIPQRMAGNPGWHWTRVDPDLADRVAKSFNRKSVDDYMRKLFETTSTTDEMFIPYVPRKFSYGPRAADVWVGRWGPSARWYVELAAQWAQEIVGLDLFRFTADAVLFYLRNHSEYYKRLYGDTALSIPPEDLAAMASAIQSAKTQMLSMPVTLATSMFSLINPIMGSIASIVGDIMRGLQQYGAELLAFPDLPKSLMRRLPINMTCQFSNADQIGQAALLITESSRGTGDENDDPPSQPSGVSPLLIVGGLGVLGVLGYLALKPKEPA